MGDLSDIVNEFLVESYENLDQLDRDLVALERDPGDRGTLGSVFRTIHTIKGTSGFLGFTRLESVAHVGENLLSKLRDGALELNPEITSGLLAMVDAVRQMLAAVEKTGQDGEQDYSGLISRLTDLLVAGGSGAQPTASSAPEEPAPEPPMAVATPDLAASSAESASLAAMAETALDSMPAASAKASPEPPISPLDVPGGKPAVSESNIRVDVGHLDKLMNLVGFGAGAESDPPVEFQRRGLGLPRHDPTAQPDHDRACKRG
ncbi:MAG: Hpt domain-containing protein [Candidatus Eisenbacteria bacterium]